MPQYVISQAPSKVVLRNFEGVITTYSEPTDYEDVCHCDECKKATYEQVEGVASLLRGDRLSIEPSFLARKERHKLRDQK